MWGCAHPSSRAAGASAASRHSEKPGGNRATGAPSSIELATGTGAPVTVFRAGGGGFAALQALFSDALDQAGIDARSVSYVESSANGSALGDALEIGALEKIFTAQGAASATCVIGSVKSNIGHAAAASGFSQLAKVVLQLKHRMMPPAIRCEKLNPALRLGQGVFRLQIEAAVWEPRAGQGTEAPRRRALISSMGSGGSYGCLILEDGSP